jgi:hypothetical protein
MTGMSKRNLRDLVRAAAPYWAGEAEVFRTYWTAPMRTVDTDLLWLSRQCFKEFWGSGVGKFDRGGVFLGVLKNLLAKGDDIDIGLDRHEVEDVLEGLRAEFSHYCAFADVYDAIRPAGSPKLNPKSTHSWPEEDALTALRYRHQDEHGPVGMRACKFTEGGFCTLFAEGMRLKGTGRLGDLIAEACERVHADEFDHMLGGIAGLAENPLSPGEWTLLEQLATEQMRLRIRMRNAQFSNPLGEKRLQEILAGQIAPLPIDDQAKARLGV